MFIINPQINIINIVGLLFDIIGVTILFKHALPINQQLYDQAIEEIDKWESSTELWLLKRTHKKNQKKDKKWAVRGFIFIVVGFILQIISTFFVWTL